MNSLDLIPTPSRRWLAWGDLPVGDSLRSSHVGFNREVVSGLDHQFFEKLDVDGQLLALARELTLETGLPASLTATCAGRKLSFSPKRSRFSFRRPHLTPTEAV